MRILQMFRLCLVVLFLVSQVGCPENTPKPEDPPKPGGTSDTDGDGVSNATDNCPDAANADQADADGDGTGDLCDSSPTTPEGKAKVFFTPASNPQEGATFTREIKVSDMDGAFYVAFNVEYNPDVLEYLGAEEGSFFAQDAQPGEQKTSFQEALEDGQAGKVTIGVTRLGQVGNVDGSGRLATLSFKAIDGGTSSLKFSANGFRDKNNNPVSADAIWEDGSVTVE